MKLTDYQWSRNPRGMHNQGVMPLDLLQSHHIGIAKLVGLSDEYVNLSLDLMANNITPIIRIYRPEFSGVPMDDELRRQFTAYLEAGIKWFEFYNEPNLFIEWPPGANFDPYNTEGVIKPICENWLNWAEFIISYGAYPGFIALSDADGNWENTHAWIDQICLYIFENHYRRFLDILNNGFWLATHPYIANHFYQEMPNSGPISARPPELQNHAEGGWHFEYPYDPISQFHDPGRAVWGGTPLSPRGDILGVTGCGRAWMERLRDLFGVGAVPVIGTEGGLSPLPERGHTKQLDTRYPGFTWESHAHATVAMFDWIAEQSPPWMFGVALWKQDHYFTVEGGGPYPAATLLNQTQPRFKNVPPLEALEDFVPPEEAVVVVVDTEPPGPGRVHGSPTFHFCILAPGISEDWFFEVGKPYFDRFRPTVMTVYEFINFLPKEVSLAATVITPPDLVDFMNGQIVQRWANVYMDLVVAEDAGQVQELLNSRVAVGRPFG